MENRYASTTETTNANRACRVILGPCTDGLRDVLRHFVPPQNFSSVIENPTLKLPHLTQPQRDLILPKNGSYEGDYTDMDISLLYSLLRNISGMPQHSKGWGKDPDPGDQSPSASIERIRLVRNRCVHSCDPSISNPDFKSIWCIIESAMKNIDKFLKNENKYEKNVNFLLHESMDPDDVSHYKEELKKQVEEEKKIWEVLDNHEGKFTLCNHGFSSPEYIWLYDTMM
jgi:hypothetical protein